MGKAAGKPVGAMMSWRLLVGTVVMLAFGYAGETGVLPALVGFVIGMAGWGFILYEIFTGEAGGTVGDCSPAVASNFQTMRLIVTIGWASTLSDTSLAHSSTCQVRRVSSTWC